MPPLGSCGGDRMGDNSDSNVDAWGDQFATLTRVNGSPGPMLLGCRGIPESELAKVGGEDVSGSGHGVPIDTFIGAFDRDVSNGGGNPNRSASEIIGSAVVRKRRRPKTKTAACAAFSSSG
jgi:hypothetical protein